LILTTLARILAEPAARRHPRAAACARACYSGPGSEDREMTGRAWIGVLVAGAVLISGMGAAAAQPRAASAGDREQELAIELARLMMDSAVRRGIDEQVGGGMMRSMTATIQERLNRRLLDAEVQMLSEIVRRFVAATLPPTRTEEIAASVYRRHFDEEELRELLAFQRSAVGRKVASLTPVINVETAQAIDAELRSSAAIPGTLDELRRAFPVLGPGESP
jgi:hypothetical protein